MKVVHVVRQYLPSVGGMEEVVRNLVQYQLAHTRYQPTVVTLDRVFREPANSLPSTETLDGIPVQRLPYRGSERYPLCPQVLGALQDADLVHVHGVDFFFDYLALTRLVHNKPLIASTHGGFFHTNFAHRLKQIFFNTVTRTTALAYRRIIATSENDGDIFRQICAAPRLQVIENGVDIFKFDDTAAATLLPTLLYFGRWSVNKGIVETLQVLAALCAQQPATPWQLIIAGREYDLTADTIRAHATQLGIGERITIHAAPTNEDLRRLISQASYFICMSHHEGFGIAPIEAMSAGLLPILSNIPPFERLVKTSGVGRILAPTNAALQATQIGQLHTEQLKAVGVSADANAALRRAARDAAQPYSWQGVAANYTLQYDQMLGIS